MWEKGNIQLWYYRFPNQNRCSAEKMTLTYQSLLGYKADHHSHGNLKYNIGKLR
jgi:hypothetical protein